ncbi:MAG: hypothetical protein ACOYN2_04270 [Patescibacteria group bacterium]
MKPLTNNNFTRFCQIYPQHSLEIREIEKAIDTIEDSELRTKIAAKINVELGVVILKNEEVGDLLMNLFTKELKSEKSV